MKKSIIALALTLASTSVSALELDIANFGSVEKAETSVIIGYGSYHFESWSHENLNEVNPSVGIEMWDVSVVYVSSNSWEETSFYVTYSPEMYESKYLDVSLNVGFATGYYDDNTIVRDGVEYYHDNEYLNSAGIIPLVGVTAKAKITEYFSANLTITPAVAMFSTSFNF